VATRRVRRADPAALDELLGELWDIGGTDLLLTAGSVPWVRVDGELLRLEGSALLTPERIEGLVERTLAPAQLERLQSESSVDVSLSWRDTARFRVNVFHQRGTIAVALRLIPYEIPDLEELGLPAVVGDLVQLHQGLVLVTGPTGSGKSTTLAAMVDRINRERAAHILTIEDPIEYVHRHGRSAVNQREIGEDAPSFPAALRAALREDPDVLLVGEMRDLETIQTALTVAETGHLVFATLHTNDTAQALDRLVDVFPGERQTQIRVQLSNALSAIVYQRLVPRIGGGRVAAFEVLVATPPVRNLIREGKTSQLRNVVSTSQRDGMQTLESSLSALVAAGEITREDALARSLYPSQVA
jgi:twitching motility protein PilT